MEVVAYFDEPPALVVRGVPGVAFQDLLARSCRWTDLSRGVLADVLDAASWVGRWLRAVEEASAGIAPPEAVWHDVAAAAGLAARKVRTAGVLGGRVAKLTETCAGVLEAGGAALPVTLAHRDFHPGNVFVTPGPQRTVTAIDCRLSAPRFAGYDVVLMDYHLRVSFAPWRFNPDRLRRVLAEVRAAAGSQVVPGAPAARVAAAEITLGGLVYFSTIEERASIPRRVAGMLDRARLERWAREWIEG